MSCLVHQNKLARSEKARGASAFKGLVLQIKKVWPLQTKKDFWSLEKQFWERGTCERFHCVVVFWNTCSTLRSRREGKEELLSQTGE